MRLLPAVPVFKDDHGLAALHGPDVELVGPELPRMYGYTAAHVRHDQLSVAAYCVGYVRLARVAVEVGGAREELV